MTVLAPIKAPLRFLEEKSVITTPAWLEWFQKLTSDKEDIIIDLSTKGLVLKDDQVTPHYWRVTINSSGTLITTDLGTVKP